MSTDPIATQRALERGRIRAEELGVAVSIAVVDDGGHLAGFLRMDGASFMTADIAIGKAWTSAAFRTSSETIEKNMAAAPAFASSVAVAMDGRFMPRQGALQDARSGGAVGVSGGTAAQDEEIAKNAIAGE